MVRLTARSTLRPDKRRTSLDTPPAFLYVMDNNKVL